MFLLRTTFPHSALRSHEANDEVRLARFVVPEQLPYISAVERVLHKLVEVLLILAQRVPRHGLAFQRHILPVRSRKIDAKVVCKADL